MTEKAPESFTSRVTYIGRRQTAKNGIRPFYLRANGDTFGTMKPLIPALSVGTVVELIHDDENPDSYYISGPRKPIPVSSAPRDEKLLHWEAEDRAAAQVEAAERRARKIASKPSMLENHVSDIRDAMRGMTRQERAVTLGWIIDRLVN